jgi:hypothetical protein
METDILEAPRPKALATSGVEATVASSVTLLNRAIVDGIVGWDDCAVRLAATMLPFCLPSSHVIPATT